MTEPVLGSRLWLAELGQRLHSSASNAYVECTETTAFAEAFGWPVNMQSVAKFNLSQIPRPWFDIAIAVCLELPGDV